MSNSLFVTLIFFIIFYLPQFGIINESESIIGIFLKILKGFR